MLQSDYDFFRDVPAFFSKTMPSHVLRQIGFVWVLDWPPCFSDLLMAHYKAHNMTSEPLDSSRIMKQERKRMSLIITLISVLSSQMLTKRC